MVDLSLWPTERPLSPEATRSCKEQIQKTLHFSLWGTLSGTFAVQRPQASWLTNL